MLLIRLWFLLLMALGALPGWAQLNQVANHKRLVIHQFNKIDSLTTAAQAEQFVQSRGDRYKNFTLQKLPETQAEVPLLAWQDNKGQTDCSTLRDCLTLENQRSWIKADFDSDGRTDLLVCGRGEVACFLDKGPQGIQNALEYPRVHMFICGVLRVVQVQKRPAIQLIQSIPSFNKELKKWLPPRCQFDTLIYDRTGFIEYNAHPKDYGIRKIVFTTTKCYGTCPVFTLQIDRNRQGRYEAIRYLKPLGVFTAIIDDQAFHEVWDLVNYINFPRLQDRKSYLNLTGDQYLDAPVQSVIITYADGKEKIIGNIRGEPETLGLNRVYELFLKLQQAQQWHQWPSAPLDFEP